MPEQKVVRFPVPDGARFSEPPLHCLGAGLPDGGTAGRGIVAFLDVAALTEESLLRLLASDLVKAVVDARPCPVFDMPRFRHKSVILNLYHRRIPYVEMAMLAIWPAADRRLGTFMRDEAYAAIEPALGLGLTLCLYDADARSTGWLEETRRMIRHARGFAAELHPHALAGLSR